MARQKALPGIGNEKPIENIEQAAEAYDKAASKSSKARQTTADSRDALIRLMRENKRDSYKAENGKIYTIAAGKEKVIVSDADAPDEPDDATE